MPQHRRAAAMACAFLFVACGQDPAHVWVPQKYPSKEYSAPEPARRPNVLVIVSDDQGFADVGVHGCEGFSTPHLDALAQGGVRCANAYVTAPVCSPTRAGLLAGRYQQRFGHYLNVGGAAGMPVEVVTIADRMRQLDYATGAFGKWHLGGRDEFYPTRRGFDFFYGFRGGSHGYFGGEMERNGEVLQEEEYLTDAIARETIAWIRANKERRFFAYCAFNAPHTPLEAKPEHLQMFAHIDDPDRRTYVSMIHSMDENIGRIMAALREEGLERDTLVFFLSDNGGMPRYADNRPFRGTKATTYDGGVHVPFFVRWPGGLPSGEVYEGTVSSLDIAATAIRVAGGAIDPEWQLEGADLVPFLRGETPPDYERALFWDWRSGRWGARVGSLKLVHMTDDDARAAVYDMSRDVGEQRDLAGSDAARLERLMDAWRAWQGENVAPLWGAYGKPLPTQQTSRPR